MRVLVIGGMHGNEPLGLDVVRLFEENPIENVDVLLANEDAVKKNTRFIEQDLNRSFPGDSTSVAYESRRAAEVLERAKQYDVVLDFHNTYCPNNDCGFVGEGAAKELYDAAWFLGLTKVVVADYDCINKYATNCLSVEVSMDSPQNQPEVWYERIACLSRLETVDTKAAIDRYRFAYRITLEDEKRLNLRGQNLTAFEPLPPDLASELGVKSPAYPIFVGDGFTPYNYGGVLERLEKR